MYQGVHNYNNFCLTMPCLVSGLALDLPGDCGVARRLHAWRILCEADSLVLPNFGKGFDILYALLIMPGIPEIRNVLF